MLVLVGLAVVAPWFNVPSDNADGAGMLAHLQGIFVEGDLLYDDEYQALGMSPLFAFVTERGLVSNHWPIGAIVLQAPGWWLGRAAGLLLVGEGVSDRAATWTIPLLGLRTWALIVLGALLWLVWTWLRERTAPVMASLATLALLLGTPLLYYATEAPMRPHLWGALVVTLLICRWASAIERAQSDPIAARARGVGPAIELAALAGLACAIRPQLAPLALLVAHERWWVGQGLERSARLRLWLGHGVIAALVFLPWATLNLQLHAWMYGEGLRAVSGDVTLHLRAFLLSTHHGALVWCPVLVLGVLALAIGTAQRRVGALLLLLLFAVQVWLDAGTREIEPYTVLGTRTWTGGTAFGPRKLLDAMPLLLPGVVWLHRWLLELPDPEARRWRVRLTVALVLAVLPTLLLHMAAWIDPQVTSTVMDGERLSIAMSLPFDPDAWAGAVARRGLPIRVPLMSMLVVGLPLMVGMTVIVRLGPRVPALGWVLVVLGVSAQVWLVVLERRTERIIAAQPERIELARQRMHPTHEAVVAAIPAYHELLRTRLGHD